MLFNKLKLLSIVVISILILGVVGCNNISKSKEEYNESIVNINSLLKYKDFYVGDNTAVGNIMSNLPANTYGSGFELQTTTQPYEISLKYNDFDEVNIKFEEDELDLSMTFSEVMIKNAMIILSLSKNAEIVNLSISDGTTITYNKSELVDAYKDSYGDNLEKITQDKLSLENFIKNDI